MESKEVGEWMRKASLDLLVGRHSLEGGFAEAAAFHSHQAIEKALKAVYLKKFGEVKKVHDLSFLGREVELPGELLNDIVVITPFYLEARYPGLGDDIGFSDAKMALRVANAVIKWAKTKLSGK